MDFRKVLVVQAIAEEGMHVLEKAGLHAVTPNSLSKGELINKVTDCAAILVRSAHIDREIIDHAPHLQVIARSGVGVDNIDIRAASEKGIYVCNVPRANIHSVAEHAVGMIIALSHHLLKADRALREGDFNVRHTYIGTDLKGKKLGIIGLGNIGNAVARKCRLGLEMDILAYDPYIGEEAGSSADGVRLVSSLDAIFREADVISLHMPYTPAYRHMINREALRKMKPSAIVINCARGGLIDEQALFEALRTGEIAGAGLDVFEEEPPAQPHPLWELDNVLVTPHMAAHTDESLARMAVGAAEEIVRVLGGRAPKHCVNIDTLTPRGSMTT